MDKKKNNEERIAFVKFWVNYMKSVDNKTWSLQQVKFIDSVLKNADQDLDLYNRVKASSKSPSKEVDIRKLHGSLPRKMSGQQFKDMVRKGRK